MMPVRALLRSVFKNVHQKLTINCFLINTDVRLKLSKIQINSFNQRNAKNSLHYGQTKKEAQSLHGVKYSSIDGISI